MNNARFSKTEPYIGLFRFWLNWIPIRIEKQMRIQIVACKILSSVFRVNWTKIYGMSLHLKIDFQFQSAIR